MVEDKQLQQLIKGCLEGDRKAQQAVYKLLYGKMKVVCMRYTRDTDQALDILQEGFMMFGAIQTIPNAVQRQKCF